MSRPPGSSRASVAVPSHPTDPGRARSGARRIGVGLVLAGVLLAGCGARDPASGPAAEPTGAARTGAAPTSPPGSAPAATPARPTAGPNRIGPPAPDVRLPWPAADAATVGQLQKSVDGGAEPWLLDPTEVAMSYAMAAHGWPDAEARARPGGGTVEVAHGGKTLVLSLEQPGRTGVGGIWVVTGERAG